MCIRDRIYLEDDEPLAEQVDVLRGVEQEIVTPAPVIMPHGGEHVVDVEVGLLHLNGTLCQCLAVVVTHILVEGVERRHDATVGLDALNIGTHGTAPVSYTHLMAGMYIDRGMYNMKKSIRDFFREILELLFQAAALVIDTVQIGRAHV